MKKEGTYLLYLVLYFSLALSVSSLWTDDYRAAIQEYKDFFTGKAMMRSSIVLCQIHQQAQKHFAALLSQYDHTQKLDLISDNDLSLLAGPSLSQ